MVPKRTYTVDGKGEGETPLPKGAKVIDHMGRQIIRCLKLEFMEDTNCGACRVTQCAYTTHGEVLFDCWTGKPAVSVYFTWIHLVLPGQSENANPDVYMLPNADWNEGDADVPKMVPTEMKVEKIKL